MLAYRQDRQKYTVLLIITDGTLNDMEATKVTSYHIPRIYHTLYITVCFGSVRLKFPKIAFQAAIVAASAHPISIIIIGVGSADFSGECLVLIISTHERKVIF